MLGVDKVLDILENQFDLDKTGGLVLKEMSQSSFLFDAEFAATFASSLGIAIQIEQEDAGVLVGTKERINQAGCSVKWQTWLERSSLGYD